MRNEQKTPWGIVHVPHASRTVPAGLRPVFLLEEGELEDELDRLQEAAFAKGLIPYVPADGRKD
jgi:hypothetical protein